MRARGGSDIRDVNLNSENWAVVKAALVAGMYPNLVHVNKETSVLSSNREKKVHFHPTSILSQLQFKEVGKLFHEPLTTLYCFLLNFATFTIAVLSGSICDTLLRHKSAQFIGQTQCSLIPFRPLPVTFETYKEELVSYINLSVLMLHISLGFWGRSSEAAKAPIVLVVFLLLLIRFRCN